MHAILLFIKLIALLVTLTFADRYLLYGLKNAFKKTGFLQKRWFYRFYWFVSTLLIAGIFYSFYGKMNLGVHGAIFLIFILVWMGKFSFLVFLFADDVRRRWLANRNAKQADTITALPTHANLIPRSEFLMKAGIAAATIPVLTLGYGIVSGAYDYQIRRQTLYLPNLPKAFDGIKLGQISDIHSGSFYNKTAVLGGVEMLMHEKADFIFFTGDLVNATSSEMRGYQDIFAKVKAPLGVFSTLGNHDYGEYHNWPNAAAKRKDHLDLIATHKNMGWNLLLNQHRRLKVDGEEIGILGLENWGSFSHFPRYGRMDLVVKDTDDLPVKLLLSHDPSHWRAQVLPHYQQIDAMFSGHTHGMQFGVRCEHFQYSPIKYVYPEWAGLYKNGEQQLYVNTGFGFIGYPGRVGILPEITIFELKALPGSSQGKAA